MKILAIETTDQAGSVALLDGRRVVAETRLAPEQRSAQWLAPAIRDLLQKADWQPGDIGLVAVAVGPGSFTGLRVGVTTAKTFAYAMGCDVLAVPTLEVVAAQAGAGSGLIWRNCGAGVSPALLQARRLHHKLGDDPCADKSDAPAQLLTVLDAGRQQVFSARFRTTADGHVECVESTALVDDAEWLAGLREGELISGPGLRKFAGRLPDGAKLAAVESWAPRAATVGLLALNRYEAGQRDDLWRLAPVYHRASAAEEKLARLKPQDIDPAG